eukprot:6205953-Amphidinium_carterae.1
MQTMFAVDPLPFDSNDFTPVLLTDGSICRGLCAASLCRHVQKNTSVVQSCIHAGLARVWNKRRGGQCQHSLPDASGEASNFAAATSFAAGMA